MADRFCALQISTLLLAFVVGLGAPLGPSHAAGLEVAIHEKDVTPQIGVPLAGFGGLRRRIFPDILGIYKYAFYLKPSEGVHDPIRAKVLVLKEPESKPLLFIALDVVGISAELRGAILDGLDPNYQFEADHVLISATHTHSGPGAMTRNEFAEIIAVDRFEQGVYNRFVRRVGQAVDEAMNKLQTASLHATSFKATDLQSNRRNWGNVDDTANLLIVRDGEAYLGAVVNLAIHGTALGEDNLHYSADAPGAIAAKFGAELGKLNQPVTNDVTPVPVLFLNGAEGDVAPAEGGPAGMHAIAARFADQALPLAESAPEISSPSWTVKSRNVDLKTPLEYLGPWNRNDPKAMRFGLDLRPWMPQEVRIVAVKLGGLRFVSWPGEPTSRIGMDVRDLCSATCASDIWVMGLTNEHLGYFTTPEEFELGTYESKQSMYGPNAGRKLVKEHCQLLAELGC